MKLLPLLRTHWQNLSRREQQWLQAALALVLLALLWWLTLAPALTALRSAEQQGPRLDAQLQQMQQLQAQAKTLQAQPPLPLSETRRLLEASILSLGGSAQLSGAGERVTVTLKSCPADALAQWLAQTRLNARVVPSEAHLVRNTTAGTWDGTLVLTLAPR